MASHNLAAVLALALLCLFAVPSLGALQVGFYRGKCNSTDVEATIKSIVAGRFARDRSIVPALLRLHFHDCFVRGCDASILLDGSGTEKTAPPNLSVRGYDLIDQAKAALEAKCPGVVSCSDIIAVATRDAVVLGGGSQYMYAVQTGRRDGNISVALDALRNLPADSLTATQAVAAFRAKGLSATDTVLLLGGHTVGITHCSVILNRLYNYNGSGKPDPTMDPNLVSVLKARCPQRSTVDNSVVLDQATPNNVDNSYYKQIMAKKGILRVDQNIALETVTNGTVKALATGALNFPTLFGNAMVKMGAIQVLTGTQGQIRKYCRVVKK
ncbi:peroxidase 57-like [Canna indica]|uniref:Peroxidase n=1 Tax=Canna indica TaxID=4628 RepID=A0AAQ3L1S0_9LILI|nr:peroxidase 57-like [Canna indica]